MCLRLLPLTAGFLLRALPTSVDAPAGTKTCEYFEKRPLCNYNVDRIDLRLYLFILPVPYGVEISARRKIKHYASFSTAIWYRTVAMSILKYHDNSPKSRFRTRRNPRGQGSCQSVCQMVTGNIVYFRR